MASTAEFQCKKCGRQLNLRSGLLQRDLMGVKEGKDLPGGGKVPGHEEFVNLYSQQTVKNVEKFMKELNEHKKQCDGEVVYSGFFMSH